MINKIVGVDVPAVGASIGFERIALIMLEKGANFDARKNLALLFDEDDEVTAIYKTKDSLMKDYNVSLFARPKNMKSFYDKIIEVADAVTSVKDFNQNNPIKML